MVKILSEDELKEIISTNQEHKEALEKVLSLIKSGYKIVARKSITAKGTFVKVYTYDRYLYRYICSDVYEIK